jgi:hypothetical protein
MQLFLAGRQNLTNVKAGREPFPALTAILFQRIY